MRTKCKKDSRGRHQELAGMAVQGCDWHAYTLSLKMVPFSKWFQNSDFENEK